MKTPTRIAAAALAALTITGITATLTIGDVSSAPRTVVQAEPLCPSLRAACAPTPPEPEPVKPKADHLPCFEDLADDYARAFEEAKR